jgi:hypothetical protein
MYCGAILVSGHQHVGHGRPSYTRGASQGQLPAGTVCRVLTDNEDYRTIAPAMILSSVVPDDMAQVLVRKGNERGVELQREQAVHVWFPHDSVPFAMPSIDRWSLSLRVFALPR